jgi:aerobic-type carbon monoxide dehydrogenase small subunit (CoxS/CutS family)
MILELHSEGLIYLDVNDEIRGVIARPADTLLYILREKLELTGTKNSCSNGDCDSCTVLIDGWPIKSCLMLAVEAVGYKITTIEGLKHTTIQKAFLDNWALQCGFCTSGFIMNCHALINIHPDATEEVIREWLESNICRCTGYKEIENAIKSALNNQ